MLPSLQATNIVSPGDYQPVNTIEGTFYTLPHYFIQIMKQNDCSDFIRTVYCKNRENPLYNTNPKSVVSELFLIIEKIYKYYTNKGQSYTINHIYAIPFKNYFALLKQEIGYILQVIANRIDIHDVILALYKLNHLEAVIFYFYSHFNRLKVHYDLFSQISVS